VTASPTRVFIGLGANLGDRAAIIARALDALDTLHGTRLVRRGAVVETPPWGVLDQPAFLNTVAELATTLTALDLLAALKALEVRLGRVPGPRWGPRHIDLDILLFGDLVLDSATLVIPHPRLHERDFVLTALIDLEPQIVHPRSGLSLVALRAALRAAQ